MLFYLLVSNGKMFGKYDAILFGIPVLLAKGALFELAVAGILSWILLIYAVFIEPPV